MPLPEYEKSAGILHPVRFAAGLGSAPESGDAADISGGRAVTENEGAAAGGGKMGQSPNGLLRRDEKTPTRPTAEEIVVSGEKESREKNKLNRRKRRKQKVRNKVTVHGYFSLLDPKGRKSA